MMTIIPFGFLSITCVIKLDEMIAMTIKSGIENWIFIFLSET